MKKFLLSICALLVLASSCKRIPMYERASGVYLQLNLRQDLNSEQAALLDLDAHPSLKDKVLGKVPELVRVCFYDAESHRLVAEDFLPAEGGFVNVPAGRYDIVAYALGTQKTQVTGTESRASGFANTNPTGVLVKVNSSATTDSQPAVFEPDHLFVGRVPDALIEVRPADSAETTILTADMTRISETWKVDVLHIEHADRILSIEFYVTGQADGRFLWDTRTVNHPCALIFPGEADVDAGTASAVFNTFGKYPQPEYDVALNMMVTTKGGNRWRFVFDATEQWLNPDNTAHHIVIDRVLDIPDDTSQGGGFDPIVSDWDGEEITIIVE